MLLRSDSLKGLKEVRGFLVVTRMYLMRYLLCRLPSLVHLEGKLVSSIVGDVLLKLGVRGIFTNGCGG